MKKRVLIGVSLFLFLTCGVSSAGDIAVVTSIYPLKDLVQQIGGEKVKVDFIVPPGASPHTFEPKPSDMKKIGMARLLVLIGAGFEFWADKAIKSAGKKDLKVLVLSEGMPLIRGAHHHGEEEEDHRGDAADPHIWLDPLLTKEIVSRIASTLIGLDPSNKTYYEERTRRYQGEIDSLHALIAERVKAFRIKEYVTFHPAWNYFSRRYGLRVAGVIEESPGKEASPKHISRLIEEVKRIKARVVFAEPQLNPKTAEVIARETGARVLFLDPNGSPYMKGRDTYINLMRYNLSVLDEAMK